MNQRVYISVFLALAVLLAGCIGGGSSKTQIVSRDMLVIKSIDIFPSKTLQPDDRVVIRMEVENAGQADAYLLADAGKKTDDADFYADYLLIDRCSTLYRTTKPAQVLSGGRCEAIYDKSDTAKKYPLIPLVKDSAGKPIESGCYMKLAPEESQTFQWSLKAPSEEEIAKMTQKCTFKFQAAYAAQAVTNAYVYFADPLEIAQRIYTKNEMSLAGDNIASYGPIAVNFAPAEPQPIPVRKEGNEKWTVFLNMKNAGSGIADVNYITLDTGDIQKADAGLIESGCRMISDIEKDIELVKAINKRRLQLGKDFHLSGEEFEADPKLKSALALFSVCPHEEASCNAELVKLAGQYFTNYCATTLTTPDENCNKKLSELEASLTDELNSAKSRLQIYSQKSSRIPCELTMPEGVTILTPFRFTTTADYTYKIRQDIDITTKPIREGA